jgi:hypothetical protein
MDFSEVIGFLVTIAAILYMFIKRIQHDRVKRTREYEHEDEEQNDEERLKDFLKSLDIDMEESKDFKPPSPPPKPVVIKPKVNQPFYKQVKQEKTSQKRVDHNYSFKSSFDDVQSTNAIENRKFKDNISDKYPSYDGDHLVREEFKHRNISEKINYKRSSRIKTLISDLPSKKEMIILNEVLNQPKGFKF